MDFSGIERKQCRGLYAGKDRKRKLKCHVSVTLIMSESICFFGHWGAPPDIVSPWIIQFLIQKLQVCNFYGMGKRLIMITACIFIFILIHSN